MLRELHEILSRRARWGAVFTLCLYLLLGIIEVTGVTSVLPFMALAADPGLIDRQHTLNRVYTSLHFHSPAQFVGTSGVVIIVVLGFCNLFSATTTWVSLKYVAWLQEDLSTRLLGKFLARNYSWFLKRNSSTLSQAVLNEAAGVVVGFLFSLIRLASRVTVIALIVCGLVYLNPTIALITSVVLAMIYSFIYFYLRARLGAVGHYRYMADVARFKAATEALQGIKATIIFGREDYFLAEFAENTRTSSQLSASQSILTEMPRFVLEFAAFGGVISMILFLFYQKGNILSAIPLVSVYTFSAYRLMPALQQAFTYATTIRTQRTPLHHLFKYFFEDPEDYRPAMSSADPVLGLDKMITLENVSFTYDGAHKVTLSNISLHIPKHATVAFVGTTGAGKTTLVDIILGVLLPTHGKLIVDDQELTPALVRSWQRSVGYVPQDIYLTDASFRKNIAFGIREAEIDDEKVQKAAQMANLDDFIHGLPGAYETIVGDRGVCLSGGQRQRIGIARALYHDPAVLILDEATSSLDGITESSVMEAVAQLSSKKTILIIAHRLATIKDCQEIFFLDQGELKAQGTYDQLLQECEAFRRMAQHTTNEFVPDYTSVSSG